ncbi:MAG: hypothetical protein KC731_06585 [Myxococcales bacterium]|nr:hypothetical protein [Myxococcales bacterium]
MRDAPPASDVQDHEPASLDSLIPKRRIGPWLAALAFALLLGSYGLYRQVAAPQPLRVLIAVDLDGQWWEDSPGAAALADELAAILDGLGFETIHATPEALSALSDSASPHEAAERLGAAYLVTGEVTSEEEELPLPKGFRQVSMTVAVELHALPSRRVAAGEATTFSGARAPAQATRAAAASIARQVADRVVPALVADEPVAAILAGHDATLIDRLTPAQTYVGARAASLEDADRHYRETDEAWRRAATRRPLRWHSPASASDRLVGVAPDGPLVIASDSAPFYSPSAQKLLHDDALERLGRRDGERLVAAGWHGYHATAVDQAGPVTVLVDDLYGWARRLCVHEAERARTLDESETSWLRVPRLSPPRTRLAILERTCRDCPEALVVMDVASGEERLRLAAPEVDRVGGYAFVDETRLAAVVATSGGSDALHLLDGALGEALFEAEGMGDLAASPSQIAVALGGAAEVALVSVAGDEAPRRHLVGGVASALRFAPDGARLAFELADPRGSTVLALLETANGDTELLTDEALAVRAPRFSPDGAWLYFEARGRDPVFPDARMLARIASVAVAPP